MYLLPIMRSIFEAQSRLGNVLDTSLNGISKTQCWHLILIFLSAPVKFIFKDKIYF